MGRTTRRQRHAHLSDIETHTDSERKAKEETRRNKGGKDRWIDRWEERSYNFFLWATKKKMKEEEKKATSSRS